MESIPVIGQTFCHYQIVERIGAGGMGEVYRARDTKLGRDVALKVLPEAFARNAERMARFRREAQVLASLNHPNIATIYGLEESNGNCALVMELVEGPTLAERIGRRDTRTPGPSPGGRGERKTEGLPSPSGRGWSRSAGPGEGAALAILLDEALPIGKQIAEGLEYAHERGIIHRDLKPANVKVRPDGTVKVLDFGLAKALEETPAAGSISNSPTISAAASREGVILGTAAYMSPEQARGKTVDRRCDIWSFGAVLFEMLSGRQAFAGEDISETLATVIMKDPDWSVLPDSLPAPVAGLLRRCLTKDPKQRLQAIGEARIVIEETLSGTPADVGAGQAPLHPGRRVLPWALAAILALALLALAAVVLDVAYFRRPVNGAPSFRSSILPPEGTAFVGGVTASGYALSPDGTRLVFSVQPVEGKSRLWMRPLNSLTAQELAGTENGGLPFWSPDGQWVGFFADGKLKKVPAAGGSAQVICDVPVGRGGTWNAQGVIVFAPTIGGPLVRVSANGGVPTPVTQLDSSTGETTHRWPCFLPDGVHFLYLGRQNSSAKPSAIYVGSLDSLSHKKILDALSEAQYAAPGYLVFGRNTTLFAQRFDVSSLSLVGEADQIAGDVAAQVNILRTGFAVSQTGQLVYASSGNAADIELIVTDRSGKQLSALGTAGNYSTLRVSPDGQKVAAAETDFVTGGATIWIFDLRSNVRSRFTFGTAMNGIPAWSPDGSQVAFASSRSGTFNVYVKPITGAAEEKALHPSPEDERPQSWSPDGRFLVIDSRPQSRQNGPEISILPLTGDGKPFSYLNASYANSGGQLSPDGRWLAYVSNESGRPEVYVTAFPQAKGKWQVSSTGATTPRWRRDGRELFFCGTDGPLMAAEVMAGKDSFAVGSIKPLSERRVLQTFFAASYDVFPDGQSFVMAAVKPEAIHAPLTLVTNWTAELKR